MLIDMRYDEDGNEISYLMLLWDTFMDQLTWDDTVKLVSNGWHMTEAVESVANRKPAMKTVPTALVAGPSAMDIFLTRALPTALKKKLVISKMTAPLR